MELWKDIQGYDGLFQISNLGNVKRKQKTYFCGNNTKRVLEERLIIGEQVKGYRRVALWNNKKYKRVFVHRLVAQAFIPNPDDKPEIDHIDGNPLNNKVDNLRWCNHTENLNNPITLKRKSIAAKGNHMAGRFGALHHNSKKVKCIETNSVYGGIAEAERQTGIGHISMVCRGARKTAGGYHWQYV